MQNYSTFLFGPASFFEGAGRIIDFGDTLTEFNVSPTPETADLNALSMDWRAVGYDLQNAIAEGRREQAVRKKQKQAT